MPEPEKGVPGVEVGLPPAGVVVVVDVVDVVVVGAGEPPLLGKYFTPVAGQSEDEPARVILVIATMKRWMTTYSG